MPRPIVLRRSLAAAAALGFGQIVLFRSWHVDKNHLNSKILDEREIHNYLIAGLSQARRTRVPDVECHLLFKPFMLYRVRFSGMFASTAVWTRPRASI